MSTTMTNEWKPLNGIVEVTAAFSEGMEIEFLHEAGEVAGWVQWDGTSWSTTMRYRARHRKPKTVMVKSLCWRHDTGSLIWTADKNAAIVGYKRFPACDIQGEVEA